MVDRVGQSFGNYRLLRLLGRGAFAEVYLAEHRYLEVPAAIKVLHVRMELDAHEQFLREARTIAHLQHPHIVRVLDFGFQDQTPYLVMEYTPNGTLRTRHPIGTRLPLEQIVYYVKQIASALGYAHQQRVIHRDVKPENVLLSANDQVVLSDFNIAVVQRTMESLSFQKPAGTPVYMAPEQIQGKPSTASDQYALGVLVYEWLCGEPPFRGSLYEVLSQHLYHPPPSLCARIPFLPLAVEDTVFGALAKAPRERFVSVQEFAEVLEAVCDATAPRLASVTLEGLSQERISLVDTQLLTYVAPWPEELDQSTLTTHLLAVARNHAEDREERRTASHHPAGHVSQSNRQRLLRKVRAFWIAGVLEHSLHGNALVALGLEEQPAAVANPWQLMLHHPAGASRPLPVDTRITEVYDAAAGELLILGAPGSGKTTLLLELARELLNRAERDEQHPLPVVFTLSSWASKQQRLVDWLVEELASTYQVPHKLGQALVDTDQILPLLDGLDEVAPKDRNACIEAINTYRQEHGLLPLVVCSRSADYMALVARIRLGSAVAVQPLTEQQVDDYLVRGGEPLGALRAAWRQNAALRELTSTPLMLSILALTYHGIPVEELLSGAPLTERQRQIFERYVERMLRHRVAEKRYTPEQTTHWLTFLARQMKQHNQTVFYIEQLQFHWLSGEHMQQAYDWFGIRLPGMLIGALVGLAVTAFLLFPNLSVSIISIVIGGLLGDLWSGRRVVQRFVVGNEKARSVLWLRISQWLGVGALIGLLVAGAVWLITPQQAKSGPFLNVGLLGYGLSFGLWNILLQLLREKSSKAEHSRSSLAKMWQFLVRLISSPGVGNGLLTGLLFVLICGTVFTLVDGLRVGRVDGLLVGLFSGLLLGLFVGLLVGPSSGLLSALLMRKGVMVQPVDQLNWSWGNLGMKLFSKRHIRPTVVCGLVCGLASMLITVLIQMLSAGLTFKLVFFESGLLIGLINGLTTGLGYWLLLGFWQGVSSATIEDQRRVIPNQGIRRSASNSLVLGLVSTLIVGLTYLLRKWLEGTLPTTQGAALLAKAFVGVPTTPALTMGTLSAGLLAGLFAGMVVGLLNGGLACLRHDVLRFLLWHAGSMPLNYPRFLDSAAERILLRKVGGGYIFVHRLLLEYFASLDSTSTRDAARE